MNLSRELNVQTRITLIFTLLILLVTGGGIVTFLNLSNLTWSLPGINTPEKPGFELHSALARTQLTHTIILFVEILLLVPLGIGLIRIISPRLKRNGEEVPIQNDLNPLSSRVDEPAAPPVLVEIVSLAEQMTEAARNANEVMAHSLVGVKKNLAMSETTLEALEEHKKLTSNVTQLIEKVSVAFQNQPESLH